MCIVRLLSSYNNIILILKCYFLWVAKVAERSGFKLKDSSILGPVGQFQVRLVVESEQRQFNIK